MILDRLVAALVAGLLFGGGLILSGMTHPANILDFLDVAGNWNPSLAVVMASAVITAAPAFAWVRRQGRTVLDEPAGLNNARRVDSPLLAGAAVFGVGWGLSGLCPGPSLLLASQGDFMALLFVPAMVAGMLSVFYFRRIREREDG